MKTKKGNDEKMKKECGKGKRRKRKRGCRGN